MPLLRHLLRVVPAIIVSLFATVSILHTIAESDCIKIDTYGISTACQAGDTGCVSIDEYGVSQSCSITTAVAVTEELIDFKDTRNHRYQEAVGFVQQRGIVKGYEGGIFKPDHTINRAEFAKIIIEAKLGSNPTSSAADCFPDVSKDQWFASYVCYAKANDILKGYPDGNFGPANEINFAEAAKILLNTFGLPQGTASADTYWFAPYIDGLSQLGYIPQTISASNHPITRGEMAEMIMRILNKATDRGSLHTCDLIINECSDADSFHGDEFLSKIDMNKVRANWLQLYNNERATEGLAPYTYNRKLTRTAYTWSLYSKDKGEITHKREGQTEYYDYPLIESWFANLGVTFANVNGWTFSENIGGGVYSCGDSDCTSELIAAIKSTFDFYMSEKGKESKPHYNSIMSPEFTQIGLGIVLDESTGKYYLTVHYAAQVL